MTLVLFKLLLAYLLSDFIFRNDNFELAKERKRLLAWQLYTDALFRLVLILLLVYSPAFLPWAVGLAIGHLAIDIVRAYTLKEPRRRENFLWSQAAHFLLILLVWAGFYRNLISLPGLPWDRIIPVGTALVFLTLPASVLIRTFIARWSPQNEAADPGSLEEAGKYIGMLERLFVFAFAMTGFWAGIGFLLAAKSVFRFGDLRQANDRRLTEYVLIGTLISFGIAMLAGVAVAC